MAKINIYDYSNVAPTDAAWLAGYLDADGCITMFRSGKVFRKPMIVFDSTDPELLDRASSILGNTGHRVKKTVARKEHHRQTYTLRFGGTDKVLAILELLLPHMTCAAKVQRGRMLLDEYRALTHRNGFYTPEEAATKLDFEARFLNAGGGRGSQLVKAGRDWQPRDEAYRRGGRGENNKAQGGLERAPVYPAGSPNPLSS